MTVKNNIERLEKIKARFRPHDATAGDKASCVKIQSLIGAAIQHMGRIKDFQDAETTQAETTDEANDTDTQSDGVDVQEPANEPENTSDASPSTDSDADVESDDAKEAQA